MDDHDARDAFPPRQSAWEPLEYDTAPLAAERPVAPVRRRRPRLAAALFVATCLTTFGVRYLDGDTVWRALCYAGPVMFILVCHEMGHFLQARRYGIHASYPYFLPMPLPPMGTMGAVIVMEARVGDRKALFDVGITGPLAGLAPTMICCIVGLHWSQIVQFTPAADQIAFGEPLVLRLLIWLILGPRPPGTDVLLHPVAFAGWVGLFITSLNLFPIGQLDGGHVLYGLIRRKAHAVARLLLVGAVASVLTAVFVFQRYETIGWFLMISLLIGMGPRHPPTADDNVPLGPFRTALGWLTLAFLPLGFTPVPFSG